MNKLLSIIGYTAAVLVSTALVIAAWQQWLPMDLIEVGGFVTGAFTVWLTVKQNIWTWPLGIANNVFFIILFFDARLYADMALQIVYIVLGVLGWYWWLRGGKGKTVLTVSHASRKTLVVLAAIGVVATIGMTYYLASINDSAPFLDALTTVMSLIAQYLLTKKYIENWYVWLSADVIYIGLYMSKALYLTGILYAVFFLMCIAGLVMWRKSMRAVTT